MIEERACHSCGTLVLWGARTEKGKTIPLEVRAIQGFEIREDGVAVYRKIHETHFAHCPNADRHRKGGGKGEA